ncbi:retinol dehydrogenase 12-like [Acanthochromis polyacanthus]|uniref:retinol dehydrogenase 12-like n=1 Tax=Acanthochromis polyacanthus TaxID=80966 RepID=UPI00223414ED|nr:retinol dehydrogenase 12-like [Acanthochromis polyacanthus]
MLLLLLCGVLAIGGIFLLRLTVFKQSSLKLAEGKTVLCLPGGSSGIGKATAMNLARRGAKVILACQERLRAEAAVQEIIQKTGNQQVTFMHLDLASLQSVRSFAENFLKSESRLDLLINNAGEFIHLFFYIYGKTEDGFGMIFGVNYLGHFLLTLLLLDRLKASGPSRVVNVASKAYESGKVDFNCLMTHKDLGLGNNSFQLLMMYCHSKLCTVLFTYELAKRLQGSNVTCYSLHPASDTEAGAQTSLHCALEPGIEHLSGHYFTKCSPVTNIHPKGRDDATSRKLWELSESFCGLS